MDKDERESSDFLAHEAIAIFIYMKKSSPHLL